MKPLHIDLLPPRQPPRWAWGVLLAVAGAATVFAWVDAQQRQQLAHLRSQAAQAREAQAQRQRELAQAAAAPRVLPPYQASAQAMLQQKTHPWPGILATMESITIEGATPVSLDVQTAERTARIELQAMSYAAALAYLDALNQGDPAVRWSLLQISAAAEGRMTATLTAMVRP